MVNTYDDRQEADVLVDYINARYKKGLNTNGLVIGLSGTGKSSVCQRLLQLVKESRKDEDMQIFIVDSLLELLEALQKAKEGDGIAVEEVSVLFGSRRAMSAENVGVAKIFDTCRKRNLCLLCNAPILTSIDKHVRSMNHFLIQTLNILKGEQVVRSKFWRLQTNPGTEKCYLHTMTRKGKDVQLMFTRMPDIKIWNEYEDKKDKFMVELYDRLKRQQIKKKEKDDKDIAVRPKVSTLSKREMEVHILHNINNLTQKEIASKLGLSFQRISAIKKNIEYKAQIPR